MSGYIWEKEPFFWCIYSELDRSMCIAMIRTRAPHSINIWNVAYFIEWSETYDDLETAKAVAMALVAMR